MAARTRVVPAPQITPRRGFRPADHIPEPKSFVGHTIAMVRPMTIRELEDEGWTLRSSKPLAIILDDGTKIYASQDDEGNGPGALFGQLPDGTSIRVMEER
jgi:hypothetical protein